MLFHLFLYEFYISILSYMVIYTNISLLRSPTREFMSLYKNKIWSLCLNASNFWCLYKRKSALLYEEKLLWRDNGRCKISRFYEANCELIFIIDSLFFISNRSLITISLSLFITSLLLFIYWGWWIFAFFTYFNLLSRFFLFLFLCFLGFGEVTRTYGFDALSNAKAHHYNVLNPPKCKILNFVAITHHN